VERFAGASMAVEQSAESAHFVLALRPPPYDHSILHLCRERPQQAGIAMPIRKHIGYAVLSVCSCVVAWFLATALARSFAPPPLTPEKTPPPPPSYYEVAGLRVAAEVLALGEVWETMAFEVKVPIRNVSRRKVRVIDIQAGCACVGVTPKQFTVEPGARVTVSLTIDLTKRAPWDKHKALRPLEISIRPQLEGAKLPKVAWTLKGTVQSRITTDEDNLPFGDRPVSGGPATQRIIEARVHGSAKPLKAAILPQSSGSASVTALGEGRYAVSVAPSPGLPPGSFKFAVELSVAGEEGEPAKAVRRIPASGVMQHEVRAFPASVFLGVRQVGAVVETTARLQAPEGSGWVVERIECDSPDVKAAPAADGYRITVNVRREGDQSAKVRFLVIKGKDGKAVPVEMTVSCFGKKGGTSRESRNDDSAGSGLPLCRRPHRPDAEAVG
jgi:hypothetical protein